MASASYPSVVTYPNSITFPSGSFLPNQVAGLVGWYSAPNLGLTQNTPVSSFTDLSGYNNHLVQGSGSLQPLYKTNVQNGLSVVRFDGVDDLMSAIFGLNGSYTFYYVLNSRTFTQNGAFHDGIHSGTAFCELSNSSTRVVAGDGVGFAVENNGFFSISAFHQISVQFNTSGGYITVDNKTKNTGTLSGTQNAGGLILGDGATNIDVGEFLVYQSAVSSADETNIVSYLKTRWNTP